MAVYRQRFELSRDGIASHHSTIPANNRKPILNISSLARERPEMRCGIDRSAKTRIVSQKQQILITELRPENFAKDLIIYRERALFPRNENVSIRNLSCLFVLFVRPLTG
jgi:hypothetical protein